MARDSVAWPDALDIRSDDVLAMLRRRNPEAEPEALRHTASLMAAVGRAVEQGDLVRAMHAVLDHLKTERSVSGSSEPGDEKPQKLILKPLGAVEVSRGAAPGETIDRRDGLKQIAARALPLRLEDWAGSLAGAGELAANLGIARSTLQDWRRSGAVVGLLKGTRKHLFPLAQFVDGRPVAGLAEVLAIVGDPRTAWLWLVEPYARGGSPLEDLKRGRVTPVVDAARDDFA
ncbi:hypothetical protein AO398_18755 [Methylobacterium sp. GXS13]|jgi:hypothetical protein|uniref:antitoxin Xre/MbcA/ParS-like domain-containing protein n=1 Tax=Methylobacterium sp. GXS13 TaxID=1730094 RepID=UPI00071B905D|nr:hypothetical protein [Methylobacterium sp. GXS13]KST59358.1 hypothetical protein AO398_18755 [Methylobacterium sp. GXS13]